MYSLDEAVQMVRDRGPRYAVKGTIRPGQFMVNHLPTAEAAEGVRDRLRASNCYEVQVYPPSGSGDLAALGLARLAAQVKLAEATTVLRAAVLRAAEAGRSEAEIGRSACVDRMTVRAWLGKKAGSSTKLS